jgi:MFS family permease
VDRDRTASYRAVFAVREFRAVWFAQILSVAGDRLALVAMSLLVFSRTHSPALTAVTYASIYLPWLLGGPLLAGLADRFPRRTVMVACDVLRTALVCLMVLPGEPLWTLVVLLFVVTTLASPFQAARSAIVADMLSGDNYTMGVAVTRLTNQIGYVAGFAVGGAIVAATGARISLAVDAGTFVVSALLVGLGVRWRPAVPVRRGETGSVFRPVVAGARLVFGDRALRTLMMLGWLACFYAVPEGLAAPYAAELGGGAVGTGLILAALPCGSALGTALLSRFVGPERRVTWMGGMAVASCGPLLLCWPRPGLALTVVIVAAAGVAAAFQLPASATFVQSLPNDRRGQAYGFANSGLAIGQGLTISLAGVLGQVLAPTTVVGLTGLIGTVCAAPLAVQWRRVGVVSRRSPTTRSYRGDPSSVACRLEGDQ